MEAGVLGPLAPAVLYVVEERKSEPDPAIIHSHNMVDGGAQDQPQRVLAVTQTYVVREGFN